MEKCRGSLVWNARRGGYQIEGSRDELRRSYRSPFRTKGIQSWISKPNSMVLAVRSNQL